jgi:hypothetical protein
MPTIATSISVSGLTGILNRLDLRSKRRASVEIEVKVIATTEVEVDVTVTPVDGRLAGPPGPRYRFIFSDDLVLQRIDSKQPGNGLPKSPQSRLAGTHSGFATTLRVADANDKFFPEGSMLLQYEGTFMFDAVTADLPSALPKGQVIVRGVALFDGNFEPLKSLTFAIVGGTGAYEGASGCVTQSESDSSIRTLNIVL